jgi:hypothetical protein
MKVVIHPALADDIHRYASEYRKVYDNLGSRFEHEAVHALDRVEAGPEYAGHLLKTRSVILKNIRRCNLTSFPFFLLYAVVPDTIFIASLIPSRTDPLTWYTRLETWRAIKRD